MNFWCKTWANKSTQQATKPSCWANILSFGKVGHMEKIYKADFISTYFCFRWSFFLEFKQDSGNNNNCESGLHFIN